MQIQSRSVQTCVLASSRRWNRRLAASLERSSGHPFVLIDGPDGLTVERLTELRPRYVFLPHWSHRIPAAVFENFECVIFHMTDLPFGRGGSPLQNLIVRGIYETQITALRCVEEMDAGPVYMKQPLSLHGAAEEIFLRAAAVIEGMILDILETQPVPAEQTGEVAVFKRRRPEEGNLAATASLGELFDMIRMLDAEGYPHAFLDAGAFRIEFTRAARRTDHVTADVRITRRGDGNDD